MELEEYYKAHTKLLEKEAELAEVRGQLRGTLQATLAGPEFQELYRTKCWMECRPDLHIYQEKGKIKGVPPGWPEQIDQVSYIADAVNRHTDKQMQQYFPDAPKTRDEMIDESPSVVRLKEYLK